MDVFIEKGGVVTCTVTGRHKKGKGWKYPVSTVWKPYDECAAILTCAQNVVSNIIIVRDKQHNGQWSP